MAKEGEPRLVFKSEDLVLPKTFPRREERPGDFAVPHAVKNILVRGVISLEGGSKDRGRILSQSGREP